MIGAARHSLSRWKFRHAVVVWTGIALNLALAVPLLFAPRWVLALFGIPVEASTIWPQFAGGLLILLSVFYVPMTFDLDRYRVFAWLSVFPSRTFGVVFFLTALLGGAPAGFFAGVLIDGVIAIASLYCLIQIAKLEQDIVTGQVPA